MSNAGMQRVDTSEPVRGYIDGCFDIMHSGHYNAIRQAKSICDALVVGVHSDQEIAQNKAMPVLKQAERYCLLEHIKWIDEIVYDVPYSPQIATLESAGAHFCIHGDDMPVNAQGVCAYDEMRLAGRLRIVKRTEGVSTTDLIGRLLTMSQNRPVTEWPGRVPSEGSPSIGRRVSADDAIEQYSLPAQMLQMPAEAEEKLANVMKTITKLSSKYNFTVEEKDQLCSEVCAAAQPEALVAAARPERHASGKDGYATDTPAPVAGQERTKAPVQLLASTRRIKEFSSAKLPTAEDRVVYVSGSFDMFHVGHAQFLKDAKALGTFLLVGIYDDASISRSKGASFPVMNLNERVLNVCACKWVDEVIIGAPTQVTEDLIKTWDIHVVARGTGHSRNASGKVQPHLDIPERLVTFQEVVSKWPELCHQTLVERIIQGRELYMNRNSVRSKREDDYYEGKKKSTTPLEN